jgi:hypothetical protein
MAVTPQARSHSLDFSSFLPASESAMKRLLSLGFAFALISSAFAACTLDFEQFKPGGGGGSGGGTGGTSGTACSGECCTSQDCPMPSDPCQARTCIANVCGEDARPDGTSVDAQTAGDCLKNVCQAGKVDVVNDDSDFMADANECTVEACVAGKPDSTLAAAMAPCTSGGGKLCDGNGACVQCLSNPDCGSADLACDPTTHGCVPASCMDGDHNGTETDTDCGGDVCSPCNDGDGCDKGSDCKSQVCGNNGKCDGPKCDDGVKNGAEGDQDCGQVCPQKCSTGDGCNINEDCVGGVCSGVGGTCSPTCSDGEMNNAETDKDCGGGTCTPCDVGQMCAGSDSNCKSDYCDLNNKCVGKSPDGTACMANVQCTSDHCVCCNSTCGGTCETCSMNAGTCTDIPANTDPANECNGMSSVCDGAGACKKPDATNCSGDNECVSGECTDGVCCNAKCDGTCEACNLAGALKGKCTDLPSGMDPDSECAGALTCDGNGACFKGPGATCNADGECQSTHCVDGLCCDTACVGLCKSCKLAASPGVCTPIPLGTDPENDCNDAAAPNCIVGNICGP